MLTDQIVDDLTAKMVEDLVAPIKQTASLFKNDQEVEVYLRGIVLLTNIVIASLRARQGLSKEAAADVVRVRLVHSLKAMEASDVIRASMLKDPRR